VQFKLDVPKRAEWRGGRLEAMHITAGKSQHRWRVTGRHIPKHARAGIDDADEGACQTIVIVGEQQAILRGSL
jgi:hypothetical protein